MGSFGFSAEATKNAGYKSPTSYTTNDLRQAIRNSVHNPATTKHMNRAAVLDWMRKTLSMSEREALVSSAWDLCIERKKLAAAKSSPQ